MVGPADQRDPVEHLQAAMGLSGLHPRRGESEDGPLPILSAAGHGAARPLARAGHERRRFGDRRLFILLRREGGSSGSNRIHRLYREKGLSVRKRRIRPKAA